MSKSYHNTIELFDVSAKKKVMGIQTDSTPMEEPKEPEGNSVYELYKLFATKEETEAMAMIVRGFVEPIARETAKTSEGGEA